MLHDNSRYINSETYIDSNNTIVFSTRKPHPFNKSKCTPYQVVLGDSLDSISHKYFSKPYYHWAILDCNPQYMSEVDIKIGDVILIPSREEVLRFYGR